ncbi:hypothetical protein IT575_07875 [bacterium]|nr:hypothetical protein [bacterium]
MNIKLAVLCCLGMACLGLALWLALEGELAGAAALFVAVATATWQVATGRGCSAGCRRRRCADKDLIVY